MSNTQLAMPSSSSSSDPSAKIPQKRKSATKTSNPSKKPCVETATATATTTSTQHAALIGPHEAIIADLSPRHDVLAASIISSSQISKRVRYALSHLQPPHDDTSSSSSLAEKKNKEQDQRRKKKIVLLHARRTADVSKMLTVVELCKRTLGGQGRSWYQYNQLFEVPEGPGRNKVEETILSDAGKEKDCDDDHDDDEEEEEEDAFEPVRSRFEDAVMPPPRARTTKSLRIFLAVESIPDLREQPDVTVQSSEET